jgi:hypothetical protein
MAAKNVNIRQIKESASTKIAILSSFFDSCGTPFIYSKNISGIKTDTVQKKYFISSYDARVVMVNKINAVVNQITVMKIRTITFFFKRRKFRTLSGKLYVVIRTCPCITP